MSHTGLTPAHTIYITSVVLLLNRRTRTRTLSEKKRGAKKKTTTNVDARCNTSCMEKKKKRGMRPLCSAQDFRVVGTFHRPTPPFGIQRSALSWQTQSPGSYYRLPAQDAHLILSLRVYHVIYRTVLVQNVGPLRAPLSKEKKEKCHRQSRWEGKENRCSGHSQTPTLERDWCSYSPIHLRVERSLALKKPLNKLVFRKLEFLPHF